MSNLENESIDEEIKSCCQSFLSRITDETSVICMDTQCNRQKWFDARQFRITGSRCYRIYTYSSNTNAQWEAKSLNFFYPKAFNATVAMKHGIAEEGNARKAYVEEMKLEVFQFGLIVPKENPWLGYSPDGIVFENGKPVKLIEIKCPLSGKEKTIQDILADLKFIKFPEMKLKEKHAYYGQVQLGMAILNLEMTDFIIYSSFDKSFVIDR